MTPTAVPTPIPALVPVERPPEWMVVAVGCEVVDVDADEVG